MQQQQQPVQQPEPQQQTQQYASQQDYEEDTSMYEYDNSGQRPSSRGSKQHMENGNHYGASSSGYASNSGHGYTIEHSGSAGNQRRDEREDDEDEMW